MTTDTDEYKKRAETIIAGLRGIQGSIAPRVEEVKVRVDKMKNAELQKSVVAIFGDRSGHPDDGFITHKMYKECLRLTREGGRETARNLIKGIKL